MKTGWDFFNSGKLKLKSILQKGAQNFCWTTANLTLQASQIRPSDSNCNLDLSSKVSNFDSKFLQNFRRPKLPSSHYAGSESIDPSISDTHGVDDSRTSGHSIDPSKPSFPTKLGVPVFLKRKIRDVQVPGALKAEGELKLQKENIKICMERGRSSCKSVAGDTAVVLPKQKTVCAKQEKNTDKKLKIPKSKSILGESSERSHLLKNQKAPDCFQPSIQKMERLSTASTDTCHVMTESTTSIKQPPQDKSLLVNGSIKQQEQLSTSKTKDHDAQKVATLTGERRLTRGEKKTIDSESNQKKVWSKHAAGKLNDLTVPELKVFLSDNKTKISGKKEELVQRVMLLVSSLNPC